MEQKRRIYEPTQKQVEKWTAATAKPLPTDEEIKEMWKKAHHGKVTGWGMMKRDLAAKQLKASYDYQLGLWQGKLDRVSGLDYSEERSEKTYNLGYYRGYDENPAGYLKDAIAHNSNFSHLEA